MTLTFGRLVTAAFAGLFLPAAPVAAQQQDLRSVVVVSSGTQPRTPGRVPAPVTADRYWTDYDGNAIRRRSLDGSVVEVLVADVKGPYGLSLDAESRQLVWTSAADEVVQA